MAQKADSERKKREGSQSKKDHRINGISLTKMQCYIALDTNSFELLKQSSWDTLRLDTQLTTRQ